MSLFGKLFKKDKSKSEEPKSDQITIKTSYTTFYYAPDPHEIGFEAEVQWYDLPEDPMERVRYMPVGVYIDCNTVDTTDASICLERFTKLFEDRKWIDYKVKLAVVDKLAGDDGMIKDEYDGTYTKEEVIDSMEITFISVYRDGRIAYSLDHHCHLNIDGSVHIVYGADGEISVMDDNEFYKFG